MKWEETCTRIVSYYQTSLYSEDIIKEALEYSIAGAKFKGTKITNLRYVDDTTLICNSRHELLDLHDEFKMLVSLAFGQNFSSQDKFFLNFRP